MTAVSLRHLASCPNVPAPSDASYSTVDQNVPQMWTFCVRHMDGHGPGLTVVTVVQSDWRYNIGRYNLMTLKCAGCLLKRGPARLNVEWERSERRLPSHVGLKVAGCAPQQSALCFTVP